MDQKKKKPIGAQNAPCPRSRRSRPRAKSIDTATSVERKHHFGAHSSHEIYVVG